MKKLLYFLVLLLLLSSCESNRAPNIISLTASATVVTSGGTVMFSCEAQDPDGDPIMYNWSCLSGSFLSGTSSSTTMWKAPTTTSETISRITVQVADADHGFDTPFAESRAIMINIDQRCQSENFGTMIVKNATSFAIRVMCARVDANSLPIESTSVVPLAVGQSTTFEITPGNIVSSAISESNWQLGLGGPWTDTNPFPLAQCEIKTYNWTSGK